MSAKAKVATGFVNSTIALLLTLSGTLYFIYTIFSGNSTLIQWAIFMVTYAVQCSGITVGFHRYITHRSFEFSQIGKWTAKPFLLIAAISAIQNNLSFWVRAHKNHHLHSDDEGDTHSPCWPKKSFFQFLWAHFMWIPFFDCEKKELQRLYQPRGLENVLDKLYIPLMLTPIIVVTLCFGSGGLSAYLCATFCLWHVTASVNSIGHLIGSQPHKTGDNSHNMFAVVGMIGGAILTFGEGWHNSHHRWQSSPKFSQKWWQLDLGWLEIWLMKKLRLVRFHH